MKEFLWHSHECWEWFTCHRRRPSKKSLLRYIETHDALIVFHGCRPIDVNSYYSNGLQPCDLDRLNQVAREVFFSNAVPPITEDDFRAAVAAISRIDHGKLFVVIDDRELMRFCGHYLIYGSEHICGIGAKLTRKHGFDYRQVLKKYGTPTVVRARLPLASIPRDQIDDFARHLHEIIWEDSHRRIEPPLVDWLFILRTAIPAEHVVGHEHPELIPDPLFQYVPYRYHQELA